MSFQLQTVNISRETYGSKKGKFVATCSVKGDGGGYPADVSIPIPDEMLEPIVGIVAQAISETMSRAAVGFAADVAASLAPPIEHEAISDQSPTPSNEVAAAAPGSI
jgi:hypothetical protein